METIKKINDDITVEEFKKIFKLDPKCKVLESQVKLYNNYIKGSYLLYKELCNINDQDFSIQTPKRNVSLYATLGNRLCYQDFIAGIHDCMKIEVGYYKNSKDKIPFWTYTEFEDNLYSTIVQMAYDEFQYNVLRKIQNKIALNYNVFLKYDNYLKTTKGSPDLRGPIWMRDVDFPTPISYDDADGIKLSIDSYRIKRSITQKKDVFCDDLPPEINRLITSLNKSF